MMRNALYMVILIGGGKIIEAFAVFHAAEAFLVAGVIASLAVLLLEPRKTKFDKALFTFVMILSFYGFWFKLPGMLEGSLDSYLIKIIALGLVITVGVALIIIDRKFMRSSMASEF